MGRTMVSATVVGLLALLSQVCALQRTEPEVSDDLYGLYYGTWGEHAADVAIVISPDGKPIPAKANDPEAPTSPGFYLGEKRFVFGSCRVSANRLTFKTESVDGVSFFFDGRFGHERIESIDEAVAYAEGVLRETRNSKVVREKKMHFSHAVVL